MGNDLWKVKYEFLYGHLDSKEYDFIDRFIPVSDDGSYYIDNDILNEAIGKAYQNNAEVPEGLVKALRKAITDNEDGLDFRIS